VPTRAAYELCARVLRASVLCAHMLPVCVCVCVCVCVLCVCVRIVLAGVYVCV